MSLPGGPANKLGNRYEKWWTVSECVRMLRGDTRGIRIELPDMDKAEFVVDAGSRREFHQVKRSHPNGKWSLAALRRDGLLRDIGDALGGNDDRFVFVSGSTAPELDELCEAACHAKSKEEFEKIFVRAKTRKKPFNELCSVWQCNTHDAIMRLRRIDVRTISERELEDKVQWALRALFIGNPSAVQETLWTIIEKSIHREITCECLIKKLTQRGYRRRRLFHPENAGVAVQSTTDRFLESAKRRLIQGKLVPREATEELISRLEGITTDSVVTGRAGSGKTNCVVEIVQSLRERRLPVLAFRFDRVLSASTTADLGSRLDLEESPTLVLAAAAEAAGQPGVLIVDQLDAVSTMSGRKSGAFDVIEALLGEVRGLRERVAIHIVLICRSFDWRHDQRIRRLAPSDSNAQVEIGNFPIDAVKEALTGAGFNPASFQDRQIDLLRLPQNLSLFLESEFDTSRNPDFDTTKHLFDRYWDEKRRSVDSEFSLSEGPWTTIIETLCERFTNTQQLSLSKEYLDKFPSAYLERMTSEGVLAFDGHQYGFGHESFFDYCFARIFISKPESLASLLKGSEQHLFRRAQVRQVLTYLRDSDPARHRQELCELLSDNDIRFHIKDLTLALIAEAGTPTDDEWEIWEKWSASALRAIEEGSSNSDKRKPLHKGRFSRIGLWIARVVCTFVRHLTLRGIAAGRTARFGLVCRHPDALTPRLSLKLPEISWWRVFRSPSWFDALDRRGAIASWLASNNDRINDMAMDYLASHRYHSPDRVAELAEPYASRGGQWDGRTRSLVQRAGFHASRRFFKLLLRLVQNGVFDDTLRQTKDRLFWRVCDDLKENRPEWIAEFVACWLCRRISTISGSIEKSGDEGLLPHTSDPSGADAFDRAAERDPAEFVKYLLPVVLEIAELALLNEPPPRRDETWQILMWEDHPHTDQSCLNALAKALAIQANMNAEGLDAIISDLRRRDSYIANYLLLSLYASGGARYANDTVSLLCSEPWRFECGFIDSGYWRAMEAIREVFPHCAPQDRVRIETAILDYVPAYERDKEGTKFRGLAQFDLLSAIPSSLRGANANRRFRELERKFGKPRGEPRGIVAGFVESPIPTNAAEKMTDDHWLRAIEKYASRTTVSFSGDKHIGGMNELASSLGSETTKNPERFARLGLRIPANANPVYLERILFALKESSIDSELKIQVCERAFAECAEFCAKAIADVLGSISDDIRYRAVDMLCQMSAWRGKPEITEPYRDANIYATGINSARGRVAEAIASLIRKDSCHIDQFRSALYWMIRDPSVAVRSCVAGVLRSVAYERPGFAMTLFQKMNLSEDQLLATLHIVGFIGQNLHANFSDLRPFVARMIGSSVPESRQKGGSLAATAVLLHGDDKDAADLVGQAIDGDAEARFGLAQVAAAHVANPDFRERCEAWLLKLFNDEDERVRRHSASAFQQLENEDLRDYEKLIGAFRDSKAFKEHSLFILSAIENSPARIPGIACRVCEKVLDSLDNDARDIQNRNAVDTPAVTKIVFRIYQQHQSDEWGKRALDMIDRLCEERFHEAEQEFEEFER